MSSDDPVAEEEVVRAIVFVRGRVQGVGFRWWTRARALELGLVGHARNTEDGRVEVVAQGRRVDVAALVQLLQEWPSTADRPGRVQSVSQPQFSAPRTDVEGFREHGRRRVPRALTSKGSASADVEGFRER